MAVRQHRGILARPPSKPRSRETSSSSSSERASTRQRWGGNLSLGAKIRGVAGVIVEGPARDVDECRLHDFPCSPALTPRAPRADASSKPATNVPITVGDITVSPGDYVVADGSAVVFVARTEIERVLAAAEDIVTRERTMAESLRQGTPISQVMGKRYETMLKR